MAQFTLSHSVRTYCASFAELPPAGSELSTIKLNTYCCHVHPLSLLSHLCPIQLLILSFI